jgi:hypothetical protein
MLRGLLEKGDRHLFLGWKNGMMERQCVNELQITRCELRVRGRRINENVAEAHEKLDRRSYGWALKTILN